MGRAGGDIAVVKVAVAAGADMVTFFAGFFLLKGAGIITDGRGSKTRMGLENARRGTIAHVGGSKTHDSG